MRIFNESIGHYINWMDKGQPFAFAGFSDAEWYCILKEKIGQKTGLGQILDAAHGELLADVIRRRQKDPWFLFAVPKVLWTLPGFAEGQIDWWLGNQNIKIDGYERDDVTDTLAAQAKLFHFINQLSNQANLTLIGNEDLVGMFKYLPLRRFIGVESPNLHLNPKGINAAVAAAVQPRRPGTFLISAGVSAAVIIDRLYDLLPGSWFFDCGSMWDAFVKIGAQREWRAALYADPKKWEAWVRRNLTGR